MFLTSIFEEDFLVSTFDSLIVSLSSTLFYRFLLRFQPKYYIVELCLYIMDTLLNNIDEKKSFLNIEDFHSLDIKLRFIYHSNAMKGNTLSLQDTRVVLEEGVTVGGKTLKEHIAVRNTGEAFDLMLKLVDTGFSNENIQRLHDKLMYGLSEEAGVYRNGVESEMDKYIQELLDIDMHPIEKAAFLYHRFIHIHPFYNGNEQTARLLMNLYLLQQGYPIVVLRKEDQVKYYRALQKADRGNLKPLTKIIAENIKETIEQLSTKKPHPSTRELSRYF